MKPFTLTINWDRLRQGEFPQEELKECDPEMTIEIEKISVLKQKITLSSTIPDEEDTNSLCYEIGALIATITANRYI